MCDTASPSGSDRDDGVPDETSFRYEIRDDLPNGEILIPIESKNGTVLAIRQGEMTPRLAAKLNEVVACLIKTGVWRRHQ
jgi:hypothetical protein